MHATTSAIIYLSERDNKDADQTVWMRSRVCSFVVRMQLTKSFTRRGPSISIKINIQHNFDKTVYETFMFVFDGQ